MYKLFLILRYLRKRRIALFAVISVWLCVAMVLIVISVMGGFLDMVKERSRGLLADLILDNATLQGFPYYQEFIDQLHAKMPDQVELATPVIYNYGLIRIGRTEMTKPIRLVGIRLDEYKAVNDFGNSLYYDKYYPGTTTLGLLRQPLAGVDDRGVPVLPDEYERAWRAWREAHPDSPEALEYRSFVSEIAQENYDGLVNVLQSNRFPGPGVYEQSFEAAGYAGTEEDARPGIIVGCDIINQRRLDGNYDRFHPRGAEVIVTLLPMTARGTLIEGGKPVSREMRLIDDSRTGVYEIDTVCAYVDFDTIQNLLDMEPQELVDGGYSPARTSQVLVKLKPEQDAVKWKAEVERLWHDFRSGLDIPPESTDHRLMSYVSVETWEERQAPFINAVEKEKVLVTLLFGLISLVAVVLIGCIFYMIVSQKTRDIGIIKSMGASRHGVATIFIGFGAAVGVVGAMLGTISGIVFVRYINEIQSWLASLHPQLRVWSPEVYTFDRIPNVVKTPEALTIAIAAVGLSMVGALIPAFMAARVWPANTLRYE